MFNIHAKILPLESIYTTFWLQKDGWKEGRKAGKDRKHNEWLVTLDFTYTFALNTVNKADYSTRKISELIPTIWLTRASHLL